MAGETSDDCKIQIAQRIELIINSKLKDCRIAVVAFTSHQVQADQDQLQAISSSWSFPPMPCSALVEAPPTGDPCSKLH